MTQTLAPSTNPWVLLDISVLQSAFWEHRFGVWDYGERFLNSYAIFAVTNLVMSREGWPLRRIVL